MKPIYKFGLVALGYLAAFVIASAVTAIRIALTSGPDASAYSGMLAFGDAFLWLNVFGICAAVPTGAALYFLRPYRRFWELVGFAAVVMAGTGVLAAVLFSFGRAAEEIEFLGAWAQLSPLRMLVAPLLAFVFLVCALVAPHGYPRIALLSAALMEMVVTGYIGLVWFVPMFLARL
jgi:hypothetical protein